MWGKIAAFLVLSFMLPACADQKPNERSVDEKKNARIVSLNSAVTELVFLSGNDSLLAGVDAGSRYPEGTKAIPGVGSTRQLNVEAILALDAGRVLCVEGEISDPVIAQLKSAGKEVIVFPKTYTLEGTKQFYATVLNYLNRKDLIARLYAELDESLSAVYPFSSVPKVLFIYARGKGTMMAGGNDTPLHHFIELSGARNVAADISGYKPLTNEALVGYNPDVILMFHEGVASLEGEEELWKLPGMKETAAAKNKRLITMESDYISSFGPRIGDACVNFNERLHQYFD